MVDFVRNRRLLVVIHNLANADALSAPSPLRQVAAQALARFPSATPDQFDRFEADRHQRLANLLKRLGKILRQYGEGVIATFNVKPCLPKLDNTHAVAAAEAELCR